MANPNQGSGGKSGGGAGGKADPPAPGFTLADDSDAADGDFLGQSNTINDKHVLIKVPDFGNTTYVNLTTKLDGDGNEILPVDPTQVDGDHPQTYLRLGKFDYDSESPAAKELIKVMVAANACNDPTDPSLSTTIVTTADGDISGMVFVDDIRKRPQDVSPAQNSQPGRANLDATADPDHGLSQAARQAESTQLYSRGGWRDHSDGNRLTTTWGDKIEVIRGNYKMVVLGRQNDPGQGMGWEASGGHIEDYAPGTMPGAALFLQWIDDANFYGTGQMGAWLLVNTTENVYQFERTAGNLRSEHWGDVHETYTGSETPPPNNATVATDDSHGTGGHEIDADIKISTVNYLGLTPGDAVDNNGVVRSNPHIIEKTWARRIDSQTGSEKCHVPHIVEKTWADLIESHTGSPGNLVGKITEETWAEQMVSTTQVSGTVTETMTATLHTEVHVGAHIGIEAGILTEVFLGGKFSLEVAAGVEITVLGAKAFNFFGREEVTIPHKEDTALAAVETRLEDTRTALKCVANQLSHDQTSLRITMAALSMNLGI